MLVRELMSRGVVTVRPDTTITDAARTLLDRDVTATPVVDDGQVVGIVSRRDLIVGQELDDRLAAQLMLRHGLASLPVMDHGRIVGMVSVTDILRSHIDSDANIARGLRERFVGSGESHPLDPASRPSRLSSQ